MRLSMILRIQKYVDLDRPGERSPIRLLLLLTWLSTTTVLFRTTFTRTIKLNLLKYWKSCANWSNITALRFGDQGTKEILQLLSQKFDRFQTLRNNSQQHATGCAMQTDAACNIYQCWEPRLYVTSNNVALVFIKSFYNWKCDPLLETENLKISIN